MPDPLFVVGLMFIVVGLSGGVMAVRWLKRSPIVGPAPQDLDLGGN